MNVLALNLAHDIIIGQRSVDDARKVYAETATAVMMGGNPPDTRRLLFTVPEGDTADVDQPAMGPMMGSMMKQAAQKVDDAVSGRTR